VDARSATGPFTAAGLDQRWCGDITYIKTWDGWAYLQVTWNQKAGRIITQRHRHHEPRGPLSQVNVEEKCRSWAGTNEPRSGWIWANPGRAPRTIDAYARGLAEYLLVCERDGVYPPTANRSQVAVFVRELATRSHRRGINVVALDSGAGLSNATLAQRLVSVRLFYDFLIEDGVRESNPVGRGRYTPGRQFGGGSRPLVARMVKLPWIPPGEPVSAAARGVPTEPIRNRLMLALAYDSALRREGCARCAPMTSIRRTARCGSGRRRPSPAASGSFPTRPQRVCCSRTTCGTGPP
jgi:hypothetical protein